MPFGCSEEQIEQALFKFVVDLLSPKSMHHIRKLYFVPVGLPGMGKSTLAKHINTSTQKHLNKSAVAARTGPQNVDSPYFNVEKESEKKLREYGMAEGKLESMPEVDFQRISYDRILGDNTNEYGAKHPETPFHEIIDIIRGKADQDYLDQIAHYCKTDPMTSDISANTQLSKQ